MPNSLVVDDDYPPGRCLFQPWQAPISAHAQTRADFASRSARTLKRAIAEGSRRSRWLPTTPDDRARIGCLVGSSSSVQQTVKEFLWP